MVSQIQAASETTPEVIYPDSDGQPMANNTTQFRWIVVIQQNLEWLFAQDPNVFIAGDLFWYPVEGRNTIVNAPDVMVAIGRSKGDRGSYQQWKEGNIPPQVVFEILSPGNRADEMDKKLLFYDRYGVEEYYIYNPEGNILRGWLRGTEGLDVIESMPNWVSPRLQIRFDLTLDELLLFHPDGKPFLSYTEIAQQAEQESLRAEQESLRAEQTQRQLEQAEQQLEQERKRSQALTDRLRALGIDPDQV